jgi:excinuclease UvrABC ATPase subunit
MSDITHLIEIMNRLVEGGNTVIVIEHNLDVISSADWIIDMGPEGGNKGGQIIFEGTPKELLGAKHSLTSKYLKQ